MSDGDGADGGDDSGGNGGGIGYRGGAQIAYQYAVAPVKNGDHIGPDPMYGETNVKTSSTNAYTGVRRRYRCTYRRIKPNGLPDWMSVGVSSYNT